MSAIIDRTPDNSEPPFRPFDPSELDEQIRQCEFGAYPWDQWEKKALAAGVAAELAQLGRSLMREAYQHSLDAGIQAECGCR